MNEQLYMQGWKAGQDCCHEEPGLLLAFRQRRAREAAFSYPQEERQAFIDGFLAGYAQSQIYKDMPPENRHREEGERSLQDIIADMESLVHKPNQEMNHVEADDLLIQALLLLGRNSELQKQAVERLRRAYAAIDKWYA